MGSSLAGVFLDSWDLLVSASLVRRDHESPPAGCVRNSSHGPHLGCDHTPGCRGKIQMSTHQLPAVQILQTLASLPLLGSPALFLPSLLHGFLPELSFLLVPSLSLCTSKSSE